jgi:hypothetical protein
METSKLIAFRKLTQQASGVRTARDLVGRDLPLWRALELTGLSKLPNGSWVDRFIESHADAKSHALLAFCEAINERAWATPKAHEALRKLALTHPYHQTRLFALDALRALRSAKDLRLFKSSSLHDRDHLNRRIAVETLGDYEDQDLVGHFLSLLRRSSDNLLKVACAAELTRVGVVEELVIQLSSIPKNSSCDTTTMLGVILRRAMQIVPSELCKTTNEQGKSALRRVARGCQLRNCEHIALELKSSLNTLAHEYKKRTETP